MLNPNDLEQLESLGISKQVALSQLEALGRGFPFMDIREPATLSRGIISLDPEDIDNLVSLFMSYEGRRMKFVPASGAATRMFKNLQEYLNLSEPEANEVMSRDKGFNSLANFFEHIKAFAFYPDLEQELWKTGYRIEELLGSTSYSTIIRALLEPSGLNYSNLPKGLLPFHRYGGSSRTAAEEHLVEGAQYARNPSNDVNIHFTVSPEHKQGFATLMDRVASEYASIHGVELSVSFSEQKRKTDTLAVDAHNNPFRSSDGKLTLRPGGHGALIENLNDLDTDLVFIKNIDNVVPDHLKPITVRFKKALAGLLISYQSMIFDYLAQLESDDDLTMELLEEVLDFTIDELCIIPPTNLNRTNPQALLPYLIGKLNRPIRVCGMVKNQGEPGGGPFWASTPDGSVSLQVVESSQIDLNNPEKNEIVRASTHFNPVDLVCGITRADGSRFDLLRYVDPNTGFISSKSKDGRELKALELPGLWNGAMSDWITIFVEVPLITFNPVKTVNDLLRDEHQG